MAEGRRNWSERGTNERTGNFREIQASPPHRPYLIRHELFPGVQLERPRGADQSLARRGTCCACDPDLGTHRDDA